MTQADLIVSTRQMKRLLKHEPADLVATAEAGMTLSDFQNQLAQTGQWLPIDPPDDGSITLGGAVATGSNGPQSFGYGSLRSFVIGMRAVLADGKQIKAGGNVVKNVAGYDLCKLFTRSHGTLGIITELNFKLRPLPPETRTIVAKGSRDSLLTNTPSNRRYATVGAHDIKSLAMMRILKTGDKEQVFNGICGAESGAVPVAAAAPAMLFSEIELNG